MNAIFSELLRSNFRCGRMLYFRALDLAGRLSMPVSPLTGGSICQHLLSGSFCEPRFFCVFFYHPGVIYTTEKE